MVVELEQTLMSKGTDVGDDVINALSELLGRPACKDTQFQTMLMGHPFLQCVASALALQKCLNVSASASNVWHFIGWVPECFGDGRMRA